MSMRKKTGSIDRSLLRSRRSASGVRHHSEYCASRSRACSFSAVYRGFAQFEICPIDDHTGPIERVPYFVYLQTDIGVFAHPFNLLPWNCRGGPTPGILDWLGRRSPTMMRCCPISRLTPYRVFVQRHPCARADSAIVMTRADINAVVVRTYADVLQKHTLQMAAALSYYFVLSLFPALILLSAAMTYLPIPGLFNQILSFMGACLPADTMTLVRGVLADLISPNRGAFLSFGILGTLWAVSAGFAATIEALAIACEIDDDRPFWKTAGKKHRRPP
jgi:virulence factor BrkB